MYYCDEKLVKLDRVFDQNKREGYLRLDLNENPGGLDQEVIDEVLKGIGPEFLSQYPETLEFTTALSRYLGTDINHLCLVNGSSEGIRNVIEAFTGSGGKIVGVDPSYAMFKVYAEMYGRNFVPVEYSDGMKANVESIISCLDDDVQLLILVNPNNPMGDAYSEDEMAAMISAAEKHQITVLIDEAYHYFCPNTSIDYALSNEHVFVTRTFSKLFSLAGCRLGYVAGWPQGIELVQKLCTPHNVNAFALRFARALFENEALVEGMIEKQLKGKAYLINLLSHNGYKYIAGEGNFIFIKPKSDADAIVERMKSEKQILIKKYRGIVDLGDCLRVTTGEQQYMQRFFDALIELDRE